MKENKILKKFNSEIDRKKFIKNLSVCFATANPSLDYWGHIIEIEGEEMISMSRGGEIPLVITPPLKKKHSGTVLFLSAITKDNISKVEKHLIINKKEIYAKTLVYKTSDYLNELESKDKFKRILKLNKEFIILYEYDKEKIKQFLEKWKSWYKKRKGKGAQININEDIFLVLENKEKYSTISVFVEHNGELVAFAVGCKYEKSKNIFVNYAAYGIDQPRNINLYVKYLRAKEYPKNSEIFDSVQVVNEPLLKSKYEIAKPYKEINQYNIEAVAK